MLNVTIHRNLRESARSDVDPDADWPDSKNNRCFGATLFAMLIGCALLALAAYFEVA